MNSNYYIKMITIIGLWNWFLALGVVASPFVKIFMIWLGWQLGLGAMAWGTARFYSENCAASGISGFFSSLFTMGSPVCISAWVGVAAFSIAYITAFSGGGDVSSRSAYGIEQ